ncbi:secondary thiamine-phosphate synthase enzyme YjbQ [Bradyrhizobium sp. LHD-71]|uniref:secondary thiamine-phosphate synthase enzyme YjbQ n=1 Tax=Bradyrhizobium sp. LHD-71 TaxID=3072141 RepID=UPI00280CFC54|nr:secondary thiamine-phosphate synthase enzyme YjbQ [Bradyrhizobium sp. LHD-71]MDQ8730403.1 secondary thiamine-phosphate synthase enzyme YjbQ [Bradyrhizobium sp. LHD-71]
MSPRRSDRLTRSQPIVSHIDTAVSSVLTIDTSGEGFVDFSEEARQFIAESGIVSGMLTLFIRHTSASLTIQENADPDVQTDLLRLLHRLAPRDGNWVHDAEGPDDMPAHIRTMLTATSLQVPVIDGRLALGTWQGIYLIEHRQRPHRREIVMQAMGSRG